MSDDNTSTEDVKDKAADDDTTGDGKAADTSGTPRTYTPEEYEALQRRMQAADRTATAAQNKLAEIENAKKDDLTKAKDELTQLLAENAALKESNKNTLLKADFGLVGVQWHNPSTAYTTLLNEYPDAVHVDDEGKVVGMKTAVEKLAKEHAYLVKTTAEEENKDEASAATGPVKNGKRKGDTGDSAVAEALRKRMPALAVRSNK